MFQPEFDVPLACAISLLATLIATGVTIAAALTPQRVLDACSKSSTTIKQSAYVAGLAGPDYRIVARDPAEDPSPSAHFPDRRTARQSTPVV